MSENQQKSTKWFMLFLGMVLVAAFGAQTYYVVRLHQKLDNAISPVARVGENASWAVRPPAAAPPLTGNPAQSMVSPLFQNDNDFWTDPFSELSRMHDEMNMVFGDSFLRLGNAGGLGKTMAPRLDLSDEGDNYVVRMELPGADKADINIEVKDRTLSVSGKNDEAIEQKDDQGSVIRRERQIGTFERSLILPGDVDAGQVAATYENGVLTITTPKSQTVDQTPHKVEIK